MTKKGRRQVNGKVNNKKEEEREKDAADGQ